MSSGAIVMAFSVVFGTPDAIVPSPRPSRQLSGLLGGAHMIFAMEHPFASEHCVAKSSYVHVLEIWQQQAQHK